MKRAALRTLTAMCFVGSYAAVNYAVPDYMEVRPYAPEAVTVAPDLMDGCWTGEAPADMVGQFPGHVVVTVHGETRKAGARMVGKALRQVFDGEQHGLTVHGFCR